MEPGNSRKESSSTRPPTHLPLPPAPTSRAPSCGVGPPAPTCSHTRRGSLLVPFAETPLVSQHTGLTRLLWALQGTHQLTTGQSMGSLQARQSLGNRSLTPARHPHLSSEETPRAHETPRQGSQSQPGWRAAVRSMPRRLSAGTQWATVHGQWLMQRLGCHLPASTGWKRVSQSQARGEGTGAVQSPGAAVAATR